MGNNRGIDFTVIGLLDSRSTELLVAGVVQGRMIVSSAEPRSGGYERVYYYVRAESPLLAERTVQREVETS